jgi:hypothetical protein
MSLKVIVIEFKLDFNATLVLHDPYHLSFYPIPRIDIPFSHEKVNKY